MPPAPQGQKIPCLHIRLPGPGIQTQGRSKVYPNRFSKKRIRPSGIEETELIRQLIPWLEKQSCRTKTGDIQPVTLDDILIVAPYNMQVNLLQKELPPGARIGTVDKFQGQEAEIVIVSMTTSSQEYLPRHMDFRKKHNGFVSINSDSLI